MKVECCGDGHFALRFVKARRVNPKNFFAELRRRNVYKVAIAYAFELTPEGIKCTPDAAGRISIHFLQHEGYCK